MAGIGSSNPIPGLVSGSLTATDLIEVSDIQGNSYKATLAEAVTASGIITGIEGITSSAAEINLLDGLTPGTVTASKALVTDANKDMGDFRNLDCVNLDAGASGTAGTVDIFPSTGSKGKLAVTCADQDGNTTVTVTAKGMGQATTVYLPDPGGSTSYLMQMDTESDTTMVTASVAEINRTCDLSGRIVNVTASTLAAAVATHGDRVVTLNRAAGIAVTLPAATGSGVKFQFIIGTTVTSNTTTIKVTGDDTMTGAAIVCNDSDATVSGFETASDSDTITFDGSTTGGIKGNSVELIDIAADLWWVRVDGSATGTEATPFSATVT